MAYFQEVETPVGKGRVTVINAEKVKFETAPDNADKYPDIIVNGVHHRLTIEVIIRSDGAALLSNAYSRYQTPIDTTSPDIHAGIDLRRTDKRAWNACTGSIAARRKVAALLLPKLIEIARSLKAERAAAGVIDYINQAKLAEGNAQDYAERAEKSKMDAAHAYALAEDLNRSHAWAIESVTEARAEQEIA